MRVASGSDGWGPGELVIAALHLVVFVEFMVALCFVWWSTAPGNQFAPVGEHVGWSVIVSNDYYAMAASLGMLVTVVALAVRRAVPLLIAAGLAAVLALVDWYVLEHGRYWVRAPGHGRVRGVAAGRGGGRVECGPGGSDRGPPASWGELRSCDP